MSQCSQPTNFQRHEMTIIGNTEICLKIHFYLAGVSNIEKARPYFEAMEVATKAQKECQSAATAFQRASGIHAAAKETIGKYRLRYISR